MNKKKKSTVKVTMQKEFLGSLNKMSAKVLKKAMAAALDSVGQVVIKETMAAVGCQCPACQLKAAMEAKGFESGGMILTGGAFSVGDEPAAISIPFIKLTGIKWGSIPPKVEHEYTVPECIEFMQIILDELAPVHTVTPEALNVIGQDLHRGRCIVVTSKIKKGQRDVKTIASTRKP